MRQVKVYPADDGGLGQDMEPRVYDFRSVMEAEAFMRGVQVGNEHECTAELLPECPHSEVVSTKFGGLACKACNEYLDGWYCPKSPDHECHYFSEKGKVKMRDGTLVNAPKGHDAKHESNDWCIFCGEPDERK